MKKIFSLLTVALLSVFLLVSCGKTYIVDFEENGGSEVAAVEVAEGSTVTLPTNPTKEGYVFSAWFADIDLTQKFDATTPITENITLYAQWAVTLTFDSNGGSAVESITKPYTGKLVLYELPEEPTKEGYVFAGWYTDTALTQELSAIAFPKVNTTAYAKWLVADATTQYTVDGFNLLDAGSYAIETAEDGSVTYTCVDRELNVQKLVTWEWTAIKHSSKGSDLVKDGTLIYTTLKATVKGKAGEKIMFKINNVGGNFEKNVEMTGETQEVEMSLEGLTVNPDETSLVIMAGAGVAAATDNFKITSLYFTNGAEGEELKTLDLLSGSWKADGATDYKLGHYVGTAEYSFGLTTLKQNVDEYNVVVAEVKGTKDIGLLLKLEGAKDGKWIEKTFTLTGEKQVIKWAVPTENLTRGTSDIKLLFCLNPSVPGSSNGAYVTFYDLGIQRLVPTGEENKESAIYFHANGGSAVDTIYATIGSTVEAPEVPVRDGFKFAGWYTDAALTQAYTFDKMPEEAIQLYAAWELDKYFSVNLLGDTYTELDANTYSFVLENGVLKVQKIGTGSYQFAVGTATGADIKGATTFVITLKGAAGQKITFKMNDQGGEWEKHIECDGTVQTLYFDISKLVLNENAKALVLFVNGGVEAASEVFEIYELRFTNAPAPKSLIADTYTELDANTYTFKYENGVLKVQKIGTGSYQFAVGTATGADIKGQKYLNVVIKGVAGQKITFKVNDQGGEWEKHIECDGTVQHISIDITSLVLNENAKALTLFVNGGVEAASEVFEIYKLEYSSVKLPTDLVSDTYAELDANTYTFNYENGVLKVQKTGTGSYQFAAGTATGASIEGYTRVSIAIKGVAGQKITFKMNDQGGSWEKHIECTGVCQIVTFDLSDLVVNTNGKALVIFVNGGVEAASEVFEVYSINFYN